MQTFCDFLKYFAITEVVFCIFVEFIFFFVQMFDKAHPYVVMSTVGGLMLVVSILLSKLFRYLFNMYSDMLRFVMNMNKPVLTVGMLKLRNYSEIKEMYFEEVRNDSRSHS
jgi:hypothetical protein